MNNTSFLAWTTRTVNALVTFATLIILSLWAVNLFNLQDVARLVNELHTAFPLARAAATIAAALVLLLNVYHLLSAASGSAYETHIRSEREGGEVSVAVEAVENTLERAVRSLKNVRDAEVEVLKPQNESDDSVHVRTTVTTQEQTKFKNVVQGVRRVLEDRWDEVMEPDENPYFEIVLGGVVDESGETVTGDGVAGSPESDDPYRSDTFSGPKYPVDENNENNGETS